MEDQLDYVLDDTIASVRLNFQEKGSRNRLKADFDTCRIRIETEDPNSPIMDNETFFEYPNEDDFKNISEKEHSLANLDKTLKSQVKQRFKQFLTRFKIEED